MTKFKNKGLVWFTCPFLIFILTGAVLNLILDRGDLVISINSISNIRLDKVFLILTDIGLGGFLAIVSGLLIFYKFRWSLLGFIDLAITGIFTNLFKRLFFVHHPRPMLYFLYDDFPRFIYDAPITFFNTFPSGHTLTIYAFCSLVAFLLNRKLLGLLMFVLAFFVGISRIYLLQHFFIDTYFGAILGVLSTFLTLWLDEKFRLGQNKFFDGSLFNILKRKRIAA